MTSNGNVVWTPRDLMTALVALHPRWRARAAEILAGTSDYFSIAEMGREVFAAQLEGSDEPFVEAFYRVVEEGMTLGDGETGNLLGAGLFESMQGSNYHRGPHDLVERRLGPRSRKSWEDLIEGWTGGGVRTVEAWRRVIRNGALSRVEWRRGEWVCEAVWEEGGVRWIQGSTERLLATTEREALDDSLQPLVARALADAPARHPRWTDELHITGPYAECRLRFAEGIAFDGKRWFVASIEDIAWPSEQP